jgi:hypothetical protein
MALTHKSRPGTYQAFAIDIGCYAHLRKLQGRFNETDVSVKDAKEKFRSAPVLEQTDLESLVQRAPSEDIEKELLREEEPERVD